MLKGLGLLNTEIKIVVKNIKIKLLVKKLPNNKITIVNSINIAVVMQPKEVKKELFTKDKVLPKNRLLSNNIRPLYIKVKKELIKVVIMLLIKDILILVIKLLLINSIKLLLKEEIIKLVLASINKVLLAVVVAKLLLIREIVKLLFINRVELLNNIKREVKIELKLLKLFAGKVSCSTLYILVKESYTLSPFLK